jgi:hypothetical protein
VIHLMAEAVEEIALEYASCPAIDDRVEDFIRAPPYILDANSAEDFL